MAQSTNLVARIASRARARPDAVAVVLPRGTISFRQLDALIWAGAGRLHASGVRPGDVAALVFSDECALLVAMLATARLGATVFSVPLRGPAIHRGEMAARARARVVVSDVADPALPGLPTLPFDLRALARHRAPIDKGIADEAPRAPWLIVSGSGSTGRPKYFGVGHAACLARVELVSRVMPLEEGDRVAALPPLDFTDTKQRYLDALLNGAAVVCFDRARTGPMDLSTRYGVNVLSATAFHAETLLRSLGPSAQGALGYLRVLRLGSSTITETLRQRVAAALTPNVYVSYGTNETGWISCATPADFLGTPGTVGRPIPGVRVEIVDEDDSPLPQGSIGRIRVRSAAAIERYLDDDEASARAFRDGWFLPGDAGMLAADGQLVHYGRADHMMIVDGINVYPAEIESVVARHPAVADSAALALRDPVHQEVPVCAVALRAGVHAEADEIRDFAFQRLGARAPRRVFVLEFIPRNEQGKPIHADLARAIAARLGLPTSECCGEAPAAP